MTPLLGLGTTLAERGLVPTPIIRLAIRQLCADRLRETADTGSIPAFLTALEGAPIADVPELANAQHYEVPTEFFRLCLGAHRKYSSCLWPEGVTTLDEAEAAMLALTCDRADLQDGQRILDMGCGWGSLSVYVARRFPRARVVAVSNSTTQRAYLESLGLPNLEIRTADMNTFDPGETFDRIASVEMFEHMRDWPRLLGRVAGWLRPGGALFIHVFCHRTLAYPFETEGDDNWMGRYFFSGGIMPSYDLLPAVAPSTLRLDGQWWVDGTHYQRTSAAWCRNLDDRREAVMAVLRTHYGDQAEVWFHRWRLFFLACEELFGYRAGTEWGVGHYRLVRPRS